MQTQPCARVDSASITQSVSLRFDGINKSSFFPFTYWLAIFDFVCSAIFFSLVRIILPRDFSFFAILDSLLFQNVDENPSKWIFSIIFGILLTFRIYFCLCRGTKMKILYSFSSCVHAGCVFSRRMLPSRQKKNNFLFSKSTFDFGHLNSWVHIKSSLLFCSALGQKLYWKFHTTNSSVSKAITGRRDMALRQRANRFYT